jgi:hypothetical protein
MKESAMATEREAAAASERELPPLPQAAVNLDSHAWQELQATGRCHSGFVCRYEVVGDAHLYTAEQMRAYVLADRAAQPVRMLTEDEKFSSALGFGVLSKPDRALTYGVIDAAIRKFCEVNGIVPLAPQDTGGKA